MHVRSEGNFPQAKLDSEINVRFLLNEHGNLNFLLRTPGHYQNWICGDVMRIDTMAAKARHSTQSPFQALSGA